jgi:hypothetical protein
MKVEVLYFKGCPNYRPTVQRLRETLHKMGLHDEIREIEVNSQDKAQATAFLGSPSVRIASRRSHLTFLMDLPARIFDAVADRLLVNIQPDVIHNVR